MGYKKNDRSLFTGNLMTEHSFRYGYIVVWLILIIVFHLFLLSPNGHQKYFTRINPLSHANAFEDISDLKKQWPHENSDLQPNPALKFGRLSNGFRYILLKNTEPKDRVSLHLDVQVGSIHEKEHQQGMAHFLEHMLFCGSTHFKPGELIKYFQSIGMQFGHDANARTGFYSTVYDLRLPTGERDSLDKALVVMKDYAEGALLLSEEIDRERKVILAEMRARDSSEYRTFKSTFNFELPETLISKRLPIGKEMVINRINRQDMRSFYDLWYRPDNMILVMVGDIDIDLADSLIKDRFNDMMPRSQKPPQVEFGEIKHEGLKPFYHYEKEAGNTTVSIEVIQKTEFIPDSFNLQKRFLIQEVADRIVQYRLDDLVQRADSPFTSASIHSGVFAHYVKYAEISAECRPENWEKSLFIIEQTLRQALVYGFTKAELNRAKKEILSDLEDAVKTASTRNSTELAKNIIRAVSQHRVFQSPFQEYELFAPVIHQLTLKDLSNSMKRIWSPEHRLILLTGNTRLSTDEVTPEAKILSTYKKSEAKTVVKPEERDFKSFPYLPRPATRGVIVSQETVSDPGVDQIDFENGIRLNLKQTNYKANEILIAVSFGNGKSSEPVGKTGLSYMSERVINESGLGLMDKSDLNRAMAGKKTRVDFQIKGDHFLFKVRTVPDEIGLAFELLYAHFMDPAFRKGAFELVLNRFHQEYESDSHSIEGAMKLYVRRFLAGGHARFGFPLLEHVNRLTLPDIKAWMEPSIKHDVLEVSVVGDFDKGTVIESMLSSLGALPKRKPIKKHTLPLLPEFPKGKPLNILVDTKLPKGMCVVAYPTDDIWDIHKTRRLSVLAEIFSERLRKQIREKLGAAYSPYAYNHPSRTYKGYGVLQAVIKTDPASIGDIIREVKNIAFDLSQNAISREELTLALDPILTGIKDMKRKNDYWLDRVLDGSLRHPQQLEWSRTLMTDYSSINIDDMMQLAKEYLDNKNAATIVILPKE